MNSRLHITVIILCLVSQWLMPPMVLAGSTTFKFDDLLIFIVMPLLLLRQRRLRLGFTVGAITVWIGFMHLSLLVGVLGYYEMDISQYMVIIRYIKLFIFILYVNQIDFQDENLIVFQKTLRLFNVILMLFGGAQFFMLHGIVEQISSLYANQGHLEAMLYGRYTRVTLTSINPNAAAVCILFGFMNEFSSILVRRKFDFVTGLLVLANIIVLFFTSSRTAFVCLGVMPLVLYMAGMMNLRAFFITAIVGVVMLYVLPYFDYVGKLLLVLDDGSESLSVRGDVWLTMMNAISDEGLWFFGFGPAVGFFLQDFDNEYVLLTTRFGMVGMSILFVLLVYGLRKFIRVPAPEYSEVIRKYRVLLLGLTVFSLVIMSTNVFYTNFQVSFAYFLLFVAYVNRVDPRKVVRRHDREWSASPVQVES